MFQKEEGVSPVIAHILMIAITVILVASLYVFISGSLFSTPYNVDQLNGVLYMDSQKSTNSSVYFSIVLSSPQAAKVENVKITIVQYDGEVSYLIYQHNFIWSNASAGSKWHYEAKLVDQDGDGKFSNGDDLIVYVMDDNLSDSITPPPFQSGDKVVFSITGYNGVSSGGVINF